MIRLSLNLWGTKHTNLTIFFLTNKKFYLKHSLNIVLLFSRKICHNIKIDTLKLKDKKNIRIENDI